MTVRADGIGQPLLTCDLIPSTSSFELSVMFSFYLLLVLVCLPASTTSGMQMEQDFAVTIPGVILTTKKGFHFCADPEVDWVQHIMKIKF
ncbi:hypothetical protein KOW79_006870 [Hemibagrus wyckioides]|uniref:Chemokine interleukin-8-like domain-containing protein n=1 Tax=Hemibagrus wyckioides TaxID=337641 RepID=A0A9D3STB1_9TELE|nr:hypothetical protein KOW79_006870 [Hemibagrus wyckioides]